MVVEKGNSGFDKKGNNYPSGFSYKMNGKTMIIQKTSHGVVLVNGSPNRNISYEKLLEGARNKKDFKNLSGKDIEKIRKQKSSKPDYEMGIGTPWGNKDNRRAARKSRIASRRRK